MAVGTTNFPTSLDTVVELVEVTNDASTALNGALTINATTITVDSTSLFPSSGVITIDSENISYTGKTGTTFTGCTRAFESTTAATHEDNATVELLITAALPTVHAAAIIAIETKLGSGAAIDAAKIADGSISNAEFQYLNGVTSAIQTQLDAKQATFGSQTANYVYAGPTSGGAASPSFRALVSGDLPSHNQAWSTITSTPTTLSGYGITDAAANGAVTASGLTMATARLLGRSTASTGAIEEITVGSGLTLSAGTLTATGGGITIGTTTITSGATTRVLFNNAGVVGEYAVTGTGNAVLSASPTFTGTVAGAAFTASGTIVQTSASATAFESGPNGGTNPVFRLVNSTASAATGLSITGNAAGSGVTLTVLSSGTNENMRLQPKGAASYALVARDNVFGIPALIAPIIGSNSATGSTTLRLASTGDTYFINGDPASAGSYTNTALIGTSSSLSRAVLTSTGYYGFASGSDASGTVDTFFRRNGAANVALGTTDAASPVAQTLSVQNVVGGTTNTAGVTTTIRGSLGTSQGAPGRIHLTGGALIAASGTTQQTAVDRIISGATKVLTNNSATTIVNVTAATETNAAGVIDYAVEVLDGTNVQYEVGSVAYGVSNKGGVFSGNTATKFGNHQNATSGTLTVTFAISGANPALLSVNANSSLTPSTGYPRITYTLRNLTQQAVAIQ